MCLLDLGAAPGGWSLYASTQLDPTLNGAVVAVDLLPLDESLHSKNSDICSRIEGNLHDNFEFIQGDFTERQVHAQIMDAFSRVGNNKSNTVHHDIANTSGESFSGNQTGKADLVLSDMAPNFTGDSATDALRTLHLCELALSFAVGHGCFDSSYSKPSSCEDGGGILTNGGAFLCKYFSCGQENEKDLMDATKRAFRSTHVIKPKASRKESSELYLLGLGYGI